VRLDDLKAADGRRRHVLDGPGADRGAGADRSLWGWLETWLETGRAGNHHHNQNLPHATTLTPPAPVRNAREDDAIAEMNRRK
jgi:hypothetical protein